MSPEVQAIIATPIAALITLFVVWLKHKLKLSDEAADAVGAGGLRPRDSDQAFIALAHKVNEQGDRLSKIEAWAPRVVDWGVEGWSHAEPAQRKPMPTPPEGLNL